MEHIILIVSLLLLACYALLIIYYRQSWMSIQTFELAKNLRPQTKISIIIAARNEENNIIPCLISIAGQTYPKDLFEVLVVDDHSTDNTAGLILQLKAPNLKLIYLKDYVDANEFNSYKKKAIEIAIKQSTGELIVTTDADCIVQPNWLQIIAASYEQLKPEFIVMPVSINCGNKFIEIFQALDFMMLQGITGASVHKKFHSMCNGANLAYSKKAFNEVNGFKGIDSIASGDDMLLLHKIYTLYPNAIVFIKNKEVIVQTLPVKTIAQFLNQRIRWASKADKYKDKRIFTVLILVYLLNIWIILLGMGAFFFLSSYYFVALLVVKTLIELYLMYPVARFFNKQVILWIFPLAQPFHILYTVIAGWLGKFGKYTWKERTVK